MDSLTDADYGAALIDYLGVSEKEQIDQATPQINVDPVRFGGRQEKGKENLQR